ncbi:unnamed protein product, partial [Prorocentrum cordatum]
CGQFPDIYDSLCGASHYEGASESRAGPADAVAAKLSQSAGLSPVTAPVPEAASSPPPAPPAAVAGAADGTAAEGEPPAKKDIVAAVKQLESALAAMSDDPELHEARQAIQARLDAKKKQLGDLKPVGKRLGDTRAALERAYKRQSAAADGLALAQKAVEAAADEVTSLKKAVQELEQQVASAHAAPQPAPMDDGDPLGLPKQQLNAAVQALSQCSCVSPEAVQEAQRQSEDISAKFQVTLEHAPAQPAPRRAVGKQRPPRLRERLNGEQPAKRYITEPFTNRLRFGLPRIAACTDDPAEQPGLQGHSGGGGDNAALADVTFQIAPANVQTLQLHREARSYAKIATGILVPKVQLLEMDFHSARLDVIGVQEGRSSTACERNGLHYRMYPAAADKDGSHGVQVWISRASRTRTLHWHAVSFTLMYVVAALPNHAVAIFISGHAPHLHSADDIKTAFWSLLDTTTQALDQKYPHANVIGMLDCIGRAGSILCDGIGPAQPDVENSNGELLRKFVTRRHFYLVSGCAVRYDIDLTKNSSQDQSPVVATRFQDEVWTYSQEPSASIDDHLASLNMFVRAAAQRHFGLARDAPRKPWITQRTWSLISQIAPVRRRLNTSRGVEYEWTQRAILSAWRATVTRERRGGLPDGMLTVFYGCSPWVRQGEGIDAMYKVRQCQWYEACLQSHIRWLQHAAKPFLEADRRAHLGALALQADRAMASNDSRAASAVVRAMSGASLKFSSSVYKLDGALAASPAETEARWVEHYSSVFRVQIVDGAQLIVDPGPPLPPGELDFGPVATQVRPSLRATVPNRRIASGATWPAAWRGGSFTNVYKKKGDHYCCDNHRSILPSDHAGKALIGRLKQAFDPIYFERMPSSQRGAIPGEGADLAPHLVRSAVAAAAMLNMSVCVLLVDLVKAFDKVARQLVYGWGPAPPADGAAYLRSLGVQPPAVEWVLRYLDERGRHGCNLGAFTFSSVHGIAMYFLRWELQEAGIVFRLRVPAGAFWAEPDENNHDTEPVIDAAFVDDEAVGLLSTSAGALNSAIEAFLRMLTSVFSKLYLDINWASGKTEASIALRGHGAVPARGRWRQADGRLRIPVPSSADLFLNVVPSCKHLGTLMSSAPDTFANAKHRTSSAMESCAPVVFKLYGNPNVSWHHKKSFLRSLFLSRELFNVHITVPSARDMVTYNTCYMRTLRRIVGDTRFSSDTEHTDIEVRRLLDMPSVDCLISCARLAYVKRLLSLAPRALLGLLQLRRGERRLPWVRQLAQDCNSLRDRGLVPDTLPPFFDDPDGWHQFILSSSWSDAHESFHYFESATDRVQNAQPADGERQLAHKCHRYQRSFAPKRALDSQARAKHGDRLLIPCKVAASTCPCCGTDFRDRLRLIAPSSDRRRPKCQDWILAHCSALSS